MASEDGERPLPADPGGARASDGRAEPAHMTQGRDPVSLAALPGTDQSQEVWFCLWVLGFERECGRTVSQTCLNPPNICNLRNKYEW